MQIAFNGGRERGDGVNDIVEERETRERGEAYVCPIFVLGSD